MLILDIFMRFLVFGGVRRENPLGRPNACAIGLVSNSSQFDIDYEDPMVLALLEGDEDRCRELMDAEVWQP